MVPEAHCRRRTTAPPRPPASPPATVLPTSASCVHAVPIGRPLSGTSVYVLDDALRPVVRRCRGSCISRERVWPGVPGPAGIDRLAVRGRSLRSARGAGCTGRGIWCGCAPTVSWSSWGAWTTRSRSAGSGSSRARSRPCWPTARPGPPRRGHRPRGPPGEQARWVGYVVAARQDPARARRAARGPWPRPAARLHGARAVVVARRLPLTANGKLDRPPCPPPRPRGTSRRRPARHRGARSRGVRRGPRGAR